MDNSFSITAKVKLFPQKGGWYYISVPKKHSELGSANADRGLIPISATVGDVSWKTSLLPMGDGTHFIALNKKVRDANGVDVGDRITVSFKFR